MNVPSRCIAKSGGAQSTVTSDSMVQTESGDQGVKHAALAAEAGLELRASELVIFGISRTGTLMQASQTAGIDLPLKILGRQDGESRTRLSRNEAPPPS